MVAPHLGRAPQGSGGGRANPRHRRRYERYSTEEKRPALSRSTLLGSLLDSPYRRSSLDRCRTLRSSQKKRVQRPPPATPQFYPSYPSNAYLTFTACCSVKFTNRALHFNS